MTVLFHVLYMAFVAYKGVIMMRYALNLGEDGRILSATYEKYAAENMPLVDTLPDGYTSDYIYQNGEYIYNPLPKPEKGEIVTTADVLNTLLGVTV